jgi:hypothetical protein
MSKKISVNVLEYSSAILFALDEWNPTANHFTESLEACAFVRGFSDGYLNQCYADRFSEPHDLTVCVPIDGPAERRAYRLGYLAGQAATLPLR